MDIINVELGGVGRVKYWEVRENLGKFFGRGGYWLGFKV